MLPWFVANFQKDLKSSPSRKTLSPILAEFSHHCSAHLVNSIGANSLTTEFAGLHGSLRRSG